MTIDTTQWTLKQKIGQLFVCGFHDIVPDAQVTELIEKYYIGGVIYFRRNIGTAAQVYHLSASLQQLAKQHRLPPLLIAIDQEGGMVSRIDQEELSLIPGNMSLGAADDLELTAAAATISARELHALGINVNFAPCVDVNNNPRNPVIGVRSYGEKPEWVGLHGATAIQAMQAQGVAATAKHFPGHGDTEVDSHYGLASVPHDRQRLEQVELLPFRHAIAAETDLIMTAHVIFPAFEPQPIPATLSHAVLTGLLRQQMGYNGVIVTDCLEMQAIAKHVSIPEAAVQALQAGADLLLVSHTLTAQMAAIEAVHTAVQAGRLSQQQIERALQRILELKARRRMDAPAVSEAQFAALLDARDAKPLLRSVAAQSITVVKDTGQLPLRRPAAGAAGLVVWPQITRRTEVDEPARHETNLAAALSLCGLPAHQLVIDVEPDEQARRHVLQQAATASFVVLVTYTAAGQLPYGQAQLACELHEQLRIPFIVASMRNPYDLNALPNVKTYICAYENRKYAVEALAAVLAGKATASGRLPVTLNERYGVQI
ncbi:beta-N-acetylhexosaminidase [Paenibacillus campi]|uniref:beta-N-acetylhexosaminidase n=1 Tax=Paenibacillus campi TaxID=3106031 RepID=UPI002AFDDC7C|nr:beta-N-acetylhexosaminidase [Paenibacillus sp. SGZ-1009]